MGAPVAAATSPAAPAPSLAEFGMGIDPSQRGCTADGDCQLVGSCDCGRCIPSKRMDVQICRDACAANPCAAHNARCDHGLCSTNGYADATATAATAFMADITAIGQLFLDAPGVSAYLQKAESGRRRLVIAWEPGVPRPMWTANGRPADVIEGMATGPMLVPTQLWIHGDEASVTFWDEPRGAMFQGEFLRRHARWSLKSLEAAGRQP
jgi:hypothetical protein